MVDLNGAQQYIHWYFITITWANLIVIVLMVTVFCVALLLPYPGARRPVSEHGPAIDREVTS